MYAGADPSVLEGSKNRQSLSMKKLLLLSFLFLASLPLSAQLGLTVSPTWGFAKNWQVLFENYVAGRHMDFLKYGNAAAMDFTFQLDAPDWQLQPAVQAARSHIIFQNHDFEAVTVSLLANVNYALTKTENQGAKPCRSVLYVQLSPGVGMIQQRYIKTLQDGNPGEQLTLNDRDLSFNLGLNFLYEIKLTPLLSLTPEAGIRYFPNLTWDGFTQSVSDGAFTDEYDQANLRQYHVGVRIGLNLRDLSK